MPGFARNLYHRSVDEHDFEPAVAIDHAVPDRGKRNRYGQYLRRAAALWPRAPCRHVLGVIERSGALQVDSVNVLARAHRVPGYKASSYGGRSR